MSHASPQFKQLPMFATPAELGEMASGDLGGTPVKNWYSEVAMRNIHGEDDDLRHFESDGVQGYLDRMSGKIDDQGGITKPAHAWIDHSGQPWLLDGHHRAQVAMDSGRLVPMEWHHNWDKREAEADAFLGHRSDDQSRRV